MKLHSSPATYCLLAATAAIVPADGFVTPTPSSAHTQSSTFVQHAHTTISGRASPLTMRPSPNRPPTELHMNLVDRFMRVAKGNVNNILKNLEAPEKIMNQAMIDMQNDLVKVRQSYAEITASQRRLERQRDASTSRAQDWYQRAQLALRSSNDGLAKEALYRRQQHLEQARAVQMQLDTQGKAADKLYEGMKALESKIQEASQRKNEFVARAKAAESTQQVNDMLSGLTGKTSLDAFRRMEEKVEALEAAAEVSAEMASVSTQYLPDGGDISMENEFLMLESSAAVDKEFENLKTKLLSGSASTMETRKVKSFSPSVESEFEQLKAKDEVVKVPVNVRWD